MTGWLPKEPYDICEYCNRGDVVLYAWHADTWCADCIDQSAGVLRLEGSVEDAPLGRPEHSTYERPFVWQTPDGRVVDGVLQDDPEADRQAP